MFTLGKGAQKKFNKGIFLYHTGGGGSTRVVKKPNKQKIIFSKILTLKPKD